MHYDVTPDIRHTFNIISNFIRISFNIKWYCLIDILGNVVLGNIIVINPHTPSIMAISCEFAS